MKILSFLFLFSIAGSAMAGPIQLIPQPVSVVERTGRFVLDADTRILAGDASLRPMVSWLSSQLGLTAGKGGRRRIVLELGMKDRNRLGKEGYVMNVTASEVHIRANEAPGIFYGLQTFLQLLPADAHEGRWAPCVEITDYPRFGWRGLMLDVSRHFFTKAEVMRYIDEMVRYKYNTLHLHLSDDQGWRLEIKSLPMLTQKGAWSVSRTGRWGEFPAAMANEATPQGGFYTQDEMREIIEYARQRYITILPEIDVPAHSLALIAAYPSLSCTQLNYAVNAGWPRPPVRDDNALCIGNDSVFTVLDKIFTELAALFPNEYIHIGGDEAYKGYWADCPKCKRRMAEEHLHDVDELQSYFVKRMETMLKSKNRRLIGWDEILEGGLAPEATVMSWRGMKGGISAARMNHQVVMTPWDYCYLDLYQGEPAAEPPTYGICRLKDSYTYDPVPDSVDEKYILGGQGNLWTESVSNFRHVEYMTWPRGLALAEVYWSPKDSRSWEGFLRRMEHEFRRMDAAEIKYARSAFNVILSAKRTMDRDFAVTMATEVPGLEIYYTFDQSNPDNHYPKYAGTPVKFPPGATQLNVITYRDGKPIGAQVNVRKEDLARRVDQARHIY